MSLSVTKIVNLPPAALKFVVPEAPQDAPTQALDFKTIGGVFSEADHAWQASGPRLQIVNTRTGLKVGAWMFGSILQDSSTHIVCVDEIQRPHEQLPFLAVAINCHTNGGMVCIFDCVTSKVIRAIHIKDEIATLHVVDAGYDVFTLPGPLRNFDGIIAVGTAGGEVFLVDICRQICDEVLTDGGSNEKRDELNPCLLCNITIRDLGRMEYHKEFAIRNSHHLAIHLNIVFDKSTKHFILKGPKGEDRIHVDKDEVRVSALFYCPQLGSLLVGYNFGALQLYNLMNLELVYTSPVCDEHIPISHFAVQEPADDPRAVCYIWAIYSADDQYPTCLPLAVMYAFCYQTKEYHEGYGCLYQDFCSASVHYQMELGVSYGHKSLTKQRGGSCLKINSINQASINTEGPHDSNEDNLTVCTFVWNVWFSNKETDTFLAIFDLNQWYKEQMPSVPSAQHTSTYMLQLELNDLIDSATRKTVPILDVHTNKKAIEQFTGAQRLEEHFYPNSLTFGMTCLRETDVVCLHNCGIQKALLAQIETSGPFCLVEPVEIYQEVVGSGLLPIFVELPVNTPVSTNQQREIILSTALEHEMNGWLCKCALDWANGSFLSAGCSLDLLISWAFQRAVTLKNNGDKFCTSLFDYSEVRLDNNTNILLGSCTRQLKNLHSLYVFITKKLLNYVSNQELLMEQYKSLETVSVYFEVLQWLLNVGLLPECPLSAYPRCDDLERISAPYPGEILAEFYNHRRALLKILNEENSSFSSTESVLYIDTLIEKECGGRILQEQWRKDGGNGLYPPPSLQTLLRTYLNDNVDLSYKHSVIIYVFLDLAMTLDQDRYKPVITQLIKFPAVFKVRSSVIKITQAFWQLDHTDYNTAMGLLLDPLITSEDLSQWHHKVALRALILQKQHNFALLYIKARRPVFKDDEDIWAAISLYVANNMVDEAFYFKKNRINQEQEKTFLIHLFNECKKNDSLKFLIYRSLESDEENSLLKYFTDKSVPRAADLHVFHHLLRSRFIETFDIHESTVTRPIENQGLFGQDTAHPRDKMINTLKKILPEINSNLINVCQKEKFNTLNQVARPTPMSVFVHNLNENAQYKSTLIGAALAKAKQTFNETVSRSFQMETEKTPFLRTPTATPGSKRSSVIFVNAAIIDGVQDHETSPPSAKRLKLSPRINTPPSVQVHSRLDTPLIKRKTPKAHGNTEDRKVTTPHSILKVKRFINQTSTTKGVEFEDDFQEFEKLEYTPVSSAPKKSGFGLSPRKSLTRSPVVRFEGFTSTSSSSLENTRSSASKLTDSVSVNASSEKISVSPAVNFVSNLNTSSKNTSTDEEVFYSPETSLEDKNEKEIIVKEINETSQAIEEVDKKTNDILRVSNATVSETEDKVEDQPTKSPVFSPKGRRSYKKSLVPSTPVRSSPRLSRNSTPIKESPVTSSILQNESIVSSKETSSDSARKLPPLSDHTSEDKKEESVSESPESSPLLPKLRPRKSLHRKVLESNTMNNVLNASLESPRSRRSRKIESPKVTMVKEISEKVTVESRTKFEDGENIHNSSFIKRHNLTTSFVESNADTSDDFSIDYGNPETFRLSDSMTEFINTSKTRSISNSVLEDSKTTDAGNEDRSTSNKEDSRRFDAQEVEQEQGLSETDDLDDNDEATFKDTSRDEEVMQNQNVSVVSVLNDSEMQQKDVEQSSKHITIADSPNKTTFDINSTPDLSKSMAYSVIDSSTELFSMSYERSRPQLSESLLRCVENRETEDFENVQQEDDDIMEVDSSVEVIEEIKSDEEKDKSDEIVYTNLTSAALNETEKEEARNELVAEESSSSTQNKEKEISDGESANNRPVDPEMNNFEIYDDLSFNDGLVIEKEVTLEENDLCYGQQNTLACVLEENIATTVSSTSLSVLEKNVFDESYNLEEESGEEAEEDEHQAEPHLVEETEDRYKPDEKPSDNEVIEIGSSSEEDSREPSTTGSQYSENSEENRDEKYFRNIYDTDDSSSESFYERHYSEISDNSDDVVFDKTQEECGVFQGDIVLPDVEGKKNNENEHQEDPLEVEKSDEIEDHISNEVMVKEDINTEERISDHEEKQTVEAIMEFQEQNKLMDCVDKLQDESNAMDRDGGEKKQDLDEQEEIVTHVSKSQEVEVVRDVVTDDISIEMDELNYSVEEENNSKEREKEIKVSNNTELIEDQSQKKESPVVNNSELIADQSQKKESSHANMAETAEKLQCEIPKDLSGENENLEEKADIELKISEDARCEGGVNQDPLDLDDSPAYILLEKAEKDILDKSTDSVCEEKEEPSTSTPISTSVSSRSTLTNSQQDKEASDRIEMPKKSSKRATDILEQLTVDTPKRERDFLSDLVQTSKPMRTLRSRRVSTEENVTPIVTRRKRSVSVDESQLRGKQSVKNETDVKKENTLKLLDVKEENIKIEHDGVEEVPKSSKSTRQQKVQEETQLEDEDVKRRSRRAKSLLNLPKIPEEDVTRNKSRSVVEGYSMHRRITRQQVSLLKKIEGSAQGLDSLDPIVLLDKTSFDGRPDLEEKKIYDVSPSSTDSTSSSLKKGPSRRLRSASQTSETSQRSKSRTPVRNVRRKSTEDNQSVKANYSKKTLENIREDAEEDKPLEPRTTRSRTRSVSSVHSNDSNASEKAKPGKRQQRVASQSTLPGIVEEPDNPAKSPIPKKRTRKSSSKL